jgi:Fe-S-cluster containining protein
MEPYNPMRQQRQSNGVFRDIYTPECQRCGVCCVIYHSANPFSISTPTIDRSPIPKKFIQIGPRNERGNNKYLRTVNLKNKQFNGGQQFQVCIALEGSPRRSVKCGIYPIRPKCCSNFDPGSPACVASRHWASMADPEDVFWLGRS